MSGSGLSLRWAITNEFHLQTETVLKISKELFPATRQPLIQKIFHQIWIDFGKKKTAIRIS